MSSGKFCSTSWRKLLARATCPAPVLEVNYHFSCTAKTTCASIPACSGSQSSTQLSSSTIQPPGCTRAWAVLCPCPSVLQQTEGSGGWRWPHTCSPGSMAHGCRSLLHPSWLFQVCRLPAASRGTTAWHNVKGILLPYNGQNFHFTQYASKPAWLMFCSGLFVFVSLFPFFLFGVDVMHRRKDRMRTGQRWLCSQIGTLTPENCKQFPSFLFSIFVYIRGAGIILGHFLMLLKNSLTRNLVWITTISWRTTSLSPTWYQYSTIMYRHFKLLLFP